jgi:hypothetical protein
VSKIFNVRRALYERADITSNSYWDYMLDHPFLRLLVNLNRGGPYTMGLIVCDQAMRLASDPGAAYDPNKGVRHQSMMMYT